MKTLIVLGILAFALVGCKLPGQKAAFNAADDAFCKTNYTTKDVCEVDAKCEWKAREVGKEVCRAKRA